VTAGQRVGGLDELGSPALSRHVDKVDVAGNARSFSAVWPFGEGLTLKRGDAKLDEWADSTRMIWVDKGPDS
jgi:hypothetical protein